MTDPDPVVAAPVPAARILIVSPAGAVHPGEVIKIVAKANECPSVMVTADKSLDWQQSWKDGALIVTIQTVPCIPTDSYTITVRITAPDRYPVVLTFNVY